MYEFNVDVLVAQVKIMGLWPLLLAYTLVLQTYKYLSLIFFFDY